jgi:hypothetical protein
MKEKSQGIRPMSRVLPTLGGRARHLPAGPSKKKKKMLKPPDAFNPSQNAII